MSVERRRQKSAIAKPGLRKSLQAWSIMDEVKAL